ncbi:thioredoxin family protein [Halorhodospira halophila]|uniref:Redox-active disulfide protein 2 n=1 Tax=Halorhodospira halophila (strain DSM 244 / SL1) TaxID=349124 RepID=A1WUL2_HALHL|nr:thioredoxin family protein [Halorhodospira halophila]ABM61374.1 redox-active disulfide protein 2 [Halorhodospira halophila SL1]MBK1729043.1 thioredoxin family protein [Halorhodospira halophila]
MKAIKVLGSGCAKCNNTAERIEQVAADLGLAAQVQKETGPEALVQYGVMSTPAVVVDEQLVHSGSVPEPEQIKEWLQ